MNIVSGIKIVIHASVKLTRHPSVLTTETFWVGREFRSLPFLLPLFHFPHYSSGCLMNFDLFCPWSRSHALPSPTWALNPLLLNWVALTALLTARTGSDLLRPKGPQCTWPSHEMVLVSSSPFQENNCWGHTSPGRTSLPVECRHWGAPVSFGCLSC